MSTPVSPVEHKLPQRSATVSSGVTRRTSMSDDEAIPDTDSSQVCEGLFFVHPGPAGSLHARTPRCEM